MNSTTSKRFSGLVRGVVLGENSVVDILVQGGRILRKNAAGNRKADLGSRTAIIAPTLFDIQVNGAFGFDLQSATLKPEDVAELSARLAVQGVSQWVPTLITQSQKRLERNCRVLAEALEDRDLRRAIPGIHLEGPYLSPKDGPRGAHPKRHIRKPSLREFDRLMKAADGHVLLTTLAPELPGAMPYIRGMVRRGVRVALGHHEAGEATIARAVDAGAVLSTHLGNGLAPQLDRHDNPLWAQLSEDRLSASLIADLHHLPPSVLKTFVRAKGPERIVLVSDAVHLAGLSPGRYDLAGTPVELQRSGKISLVGTKLLAGSSLMLIQGVANAAHHTDLTLQQAFASASQVPAGILGIKDAFLRTEKGNTANFLILERAPKGDQHGFRFLTSIIRGEEHAGRPA